MSNQNSEGRARVLVTRLQRYPCPPEQWPQTRSVISMITEILRVGCTLPEGWQLDIDTMEMGVLVDARHPLVYERQIRHLWERWNTGYSASEWLVLMDNTLLPRSVESLRILDSILAENGKVGVVSMGPVDLTVLRNTRHHPIRSHGFGIINHSSLVLALPLTIRPSHDLRFIAIPAALVGAVFTDLIDYFCATSFVSLEYNYALVAPLERQGSYELSQITARWAIAQPGKPLPDSPWVLPEGNIRNPEFVKYLSQRWASLCQYSV